MKKIYFIFIPILSFLSAAMMTYVSLVNPIGPWVSPVIAVLMVGLSQYFSFNDKFVFNVTASASFAGIIGTAMSFSFPAYYFLDPVGFNSLISNYWLYFLKIFSLLASASFLGFSFANCMKDKFLNDPQLTFPLGEFNFNLISSKKTLKQSRDMLISVLSSFIFCTIQDGLGFFGGVIPRTITFLRPFIIKGISFSGVRFDIYPLYWAIGYIVGISIIKPLFIGSLLKFIFIEPLYNKLFSDLKYEEFQISYCGGMVFYTFLYSVFYWIKNNIKKIRGFSNLKLNKSFMFFLKDIYISLILSAIFLYFVGFSLVKITYLIFATLIAAYQVVFIAGKIGLAQLGRFATFAMIPVIFLFDTDFLQLIILVTFVEVACGVAVEKLFSQKLALKANLNNRSLNYLQFLGIISGCFAVATVFLWLVTNFKLGSADLIAQRAQTRYWLISMKFVYNHSIVWGIFTGIFLTIFNVSLLMVLGGILMPLNISLGISLGALISYFISNKEEKDPIASGVFVGQTLSLMVSAILKLL